MPKLKKSREEQSDMLLISTIKKYLYLSGVSHDELAAAVRLSKRTLFDRYNNPSDFRLSELRQLKKKLHIPKDEIDILE